MNAIKERRTAITLDGREYKLSFNLNVVADFEEKFGELGKPFETLNSGKIAPVRWLLWRLIDEAVEEHNDSNVEKWEHLTEKQVGRFFTFDKIAEFTNIVTATVTNGLPEDKSGVSADDEELLKKEGFDTQESPNAEMP